MTSLYVVSVDTVDGPTLRGRVHLINPDAWKVPKRVTFPLALLVEAWSLPANGHLHDDGDRIPHGDRYPFSAERGKKIVADMRLTDEFSALHGFIFGTMVRVDAAGHLLADDGRTVLEPRREAKDVYELGGVSGQDETSSYVLTMSNAEAFYRRAADIVTAYQTGPVRNAPLWSEVAEWDDPYQPWTPEESREGIAARKGPADLAYWRVWQLLENRPFGERPYVDITVTVGDPAYLAHLTEGMRWSTAHTGRV